MQLNLIYKLKQLSYLKKIKVDNDEGRYIAFKNRTFNKEIFLFKI